MEAAKFTIAVSDRKRTAFLQACDAFDKFKVLMSGIYEIQVNAPADMNADAAADLAATIRESVEKDFMTLFIYNDKTGSVFETKQYPAHRQR